MHVIAFTSQKGGVGKTTLIMHLPTVSVAGTINTALLDLNRRHPQPNGRTPGKMKGQSYRGPGRAAPKKVIEERKVVNTDILIIDTAPHTESTALTAARTSHVVLVLADPPSWIS